jgi:hypothetical protein
VAWAVGLRFTKSRVLFVSLAVAVATFGSAASAHALTTYESCTFSGRGRFATPLTSSAAIRWDKLTLKAKLSNCSGALDGSFHVNGSVRAYYASCAGPGSQDTHHLNLNVNHLTITWSSSSTSIVQPMSWFVPSNTVDVRDMTGDIASGPFAGGGMQFRSEITYTLIGSCSAPPVTGITFSVPMTIYGPP